MTAAADEIRWIAARIAEVMAWIRMAAPEPTGTRDAASELDTLRADVSRMPLPNGSVVLAALERALGALRAGDRVEAVQRLSEALYNVTRV